MTTNIVLPLENGHDRYYFGNEFRNRLNFTIFVWVRKYTTSHNKGWRHNWLYKKTLEHRNDILRTTFNQTQYNWSTLNAGSI